MKRTVTGAEGLLKIKIHGKLAMQQYIEVYKQ